MVDLFEDLAADRRVIHEDHPSIKIALDLDALSENERREVALMLQRALDRLAAPDPAG